MVEWGRLLSGFRGEILGRRFESCPPRHMKKRVPAKGVERVLLLATTGINYVRCLVNSTYCGFLRMCVATYEHIGITRNDFSRAYASATSVILPAIP